MIFSFRLLWQLSSLVVLLLSLNFGPSCLVLGDLVEEQVVLEPGLDQTLDHIKYQASTESSSARHIREKQRLLKSLERTEENWRTDHPRYRLLQALHGFVRHKERYVDQLEGWQKSYNGIPDPQKKVIYSLRQSPFTSFLGLT